MLAQPIAEELVQRQPQVEQRHELIRACVSRTAPPIHPSCSLEGNLEHGPRASPWGELLHQRQAPVLAHHVRVPPSKPRLVVSALARPRHGELDCEDGVELLVVHS